MTDGSRRFFSRLLLSAGLLLCGAALLHYARGWRAQAKASQSFGHARENPGIARVSSDGATAAGYPFGEPLARLKVPSAQMDYYVFGGSDADTLEKGPGHVPGTAMPGEEGARNNCVITAHRDTHFRRLGWLRKGHSISLQTPARERSYRVVSREIVTPDAVRVLRPTEKPRLTLITCYPFNYVGPAPKRLVVVAEPVS